ncbi:hypothetical protein Btru_017653 [Bulinus truncatus]|nr:hypothetical protein Btru_017653 [Bulinus truncatus]
MNVLEPFIFACTVSCITLCLAVNISACNTGWFGSKCQYLCHCDSRGSCDVNGKCSNKCASGWFGFNCQYQDLTKNTQAILSTKPEQDIPTWLTDWDDATCNADQSLQALNISWPKEQSFTWLRVKVTNASANLGLALTFIPALARSPIIRCNPLITVLDDTTIDFRCNVTSLIRTIVITGSGLKSLCSVYVSGGRNVALKQSAKVLYEYSPLYGAHLAVDGNTNNHFDGYSCTFTISTDRDLSWTLTLDSARTVNKFIIYNIGDCCTWRLYNLKLELFDANNYNTWTHQDTSGIRDVYTFFNGQTSIMSKLRISLAVKDNLYEYAYLTLCEVEVYGECVAGSWGLECNKTCPSDCPLWCHQDTGQCQSCIGYNDPPVCEHECIEGDYGLNCQHKCSSHCYNNSCDGLTGVCEKGCLGYINPPDCNIACTSGFFGKNCNSPCGDNCYQRSCDRATGLCDKACFGFSDFPTCTLSVCEIGCNGYSNPPECNVECQSGLWGINCENKCGENCYNESCDRITGVCDIGCNGYNNPPECNDECTQGQWGHNCEERCGVRCYNESCDRMTGVCDIGCNGYSDPPECNQECQVNMWGHNCENNCGKNCYNESCNRVSGVCDNGCNGHNNPPECNVECQSGLYGFNCENNCVENCYNESCDIITGVCDIGCNGYNNPPDCNQECTKGQWGHNCEDTCEVKCYNEECDRVRGVCDNGCNGYDNPPECNEECPSGQWGHNCESKCGDNCYNTSCDRVNGDCDKGCNGYSNPPGCFIECLTDHWGHNCEYKCGANCYNETCHGNTGVCDRGCNGYSNPPECNVDCSKGLYGPNCSIECPPNCKDAACNEIGFCVSCQVGYVGRFCDQIAEVKYWTPEIRTSLAIGTLVVIVIGVVVLIVICRTKRKHPHTTGRQNNEDNSLTMLQSYDSVKLNNEYQPSIPEPSGGDSENLIGKGLIQSSECEKPTGTNCETKIEQCDSL